MFVVHQNNKPNYFFVKIYLTKFINNIVIISDSVSQFVQK